MYINNITASREFVIIWGCLIGKINESMKDEVYVSIDINECTAYTL